MLSTFINLVGCAKTFPRWCAGRVQQVSARRRFNEDAVSEAGLIVVASAGFILLACPTRLGAWPRSSARVPVQQVELKTVRVAMAYRLLLAYAFRVWQSEQNSSHPQIDCDRGRWTRFARRAGSSSMMVSYEPDFVDQFRRAASYVDRILKGEKLAARRRNHRCQHA